MSHHTCGTAWLDQAKMFARLEGGGFGRGQFPARLCGTVYHARTAATEDEQPHRAPCDNRCRPFRNPCRRPVFSNRWCTAECSDPALHTSRRQAGALFDRPIHFRRSASQERPGHQTAAPPVGNRMQRNCRSVRALSFARPGYLPAARDRVSRDAFRRAETARIV